MLAPLFWISSPVTGDAESVLTPAGSQPLPTRASHSQPTRVWPIEVRAAGRLCVEAGVAVDPVRALRRVDDEREVLRVVVADVHLAASARSPGWFAPAGSRHVPVGMPLGSAPPLWVDL